MNKTMWEILVPTKMHDKPVRTMHHKAWDEKVSEISKGLTILKPAKGIWISPKGELFHDEMIPVRIACTEKQINKIMKITIKHYEQEAVMARLISQCVKVMYNE